MEKTQVAIIGAGPVGLYTAFYARMRGLDVTVLDSLETVGGQVAHLYPQKDLLDIPGFTKIDGQTLVKNLKQQADQLETRFSLNTVVQDLNYDATHDYFVLQTNQGELIAQRVVLAIGRGAFEPKRLPNGIGSAFEGQGVYYIADDLQHFAGRDVLVAGGGDSAVDQALALVPYAHQVYLTHRRNRFRAMAYTLEQLANTNVKQLTPYNITDIQAASGKLAVNLENNEDQTDQTLLVDDVVVSYGFQSNSQMIEGWTCHPVIERQRCVVRQDMATTVPGLYAVGDIAGYPGKADLIATGFGEGPVAILSILKELDPAAAGPLHSSGFTITDGDLNPLK
ncbi:thioredoxin reductase (NADPH) [Weissella uvarum]|uniref:FAD-dependent oxidoreductase n=1 Tax=Weissella uvarum TaxID=1479233 RepID=UPI0019600167|nr:thioredoxin reductase (NADPH) [Weissella uvarum]MCM0596042.1 NAD(P)/FAD-dependent oxidoreductase [Weissella uvarum]